MFTYEKNFAPASDGRCRTSLAAWRLRLQHHIPELAFSPENACSPETFLQWKSKVAAKLKELLQMPESYPDQPAPSLLCSEPREGYALEHWEAYPDPWTAVPFLILRPDSQSKPLPAVLCIPGSHHSKESLAGEPLPDNPNCPPIHFPERNCQALHFVHQGYIALAFDNPGTATIAESDSDDKETQWAGRVRLVEGLLFSGTTYLGLSVSQKLPVLDWLSAQSWVDPSRIAVCGHSLGSEAAMALGILDSRFSAVIFNDFVCNANHRWASVTEMTPEEYRDSGNWHILPGQWRFFGFEDLLAALAPKYLALNEGGAEEYLDKIRIAYQLQNAPERLQITYYPKYAGSPKLHAPVPEQGLATKDYYETYCSVEVPDHSFRVQPSLNLLRKAFAQPE